MSACFGVGGGGAPWPRAVGAISAAPFPCGGGAQRLNTTGLLQCRSRAGRASTDPEPSTVSSFRWARGMTIVAAPDCLLYHAMAGQVPAALGHFRRDRFRWSATMIDLRYSESYSLKPSSLVPPPNVSARSRPLSPAWRPTRWATSCWRSRREAGWPSHYDSSRFRRHQGCPRCEPCCPGR
jgi:hypothetical protein